MKKRINITVLALVCILAAGCKDFLDVKPKGKDIPEKYEHYNGLFNDIQLTNFGYNQVSGIGTKLGENLLYNIFMSDELTGDETSVSNMDFQMSQAYRWQGGIFTEEDNVCEWATMYQQIYTYNVIIGEVLDARGGTADQKLRLQAEARASRAMRYLVLAQYFGKPYNAATAAADLCVPIIREADMNLTNLPRNTVAEVYEFITTELEECCPLLPQSTVHHLRVAQCAGYFFLGRAYLFMGEYEKARGALEKSLEASADNTIGLTLYDYNTMIPEWGYNAAKPYGWTSGFPANNTGDNKEVIYNLQYPVTQLVSAMSQPKLFVKPEYMALYGENDQRLKFFSDKTSAGVASRGFRRLPCRSNFSMGAEMPDLWLMLIECQLRSEDATVRAEGRENLEMFRAKRMPAQDAAIPAGADTREGLVRFVVEERLREYMMTGLRWFDMRRLWDDPLFQADKENYTHTDGTESYRLTAERLVYRIPPKVMPFHNWQDNE